MNDEKKAPFSLLTACILGIVLVAFVISLMLPSLHSPRELAPRTRCASNLKGLGEALYIYAQDGDVFAMNSGVDQSNSGAMRLFFPSDRGPTRPSTTGTPSPTVDLWMLLRDNNSTPMQFTCPTTDDKPDPAKDTTAYYDFLTAMYLSYAYQFQHDPNRKALGTSSELHFPLMADSNPYIKGGITTGAAADRNSASRGNTTNHDDREGQNVLFVDSHVQFSKAPDVGLPGLNLGTVPTSTGHDNIYSVHVAGAEVDPGEHGSKLNSTTCQVGDQTDAALVP